MGEDQPNLHVGFDSLTFPLDKPLVVVNCDEGPIEGAGITWDVRDGQIVVTVEFQPRGLDPIQISLAEDDEGDFEVIMPPAVIRRADIQQKED